jgi:hypothetical protein
MLMLVRFAVRPYPRLKRPQEFRRVSPARHKGLAARRLDPLSGTGVRPSPLPHANLTPPELVAHAPTEVPGVSTEVLNPRRPWAHGAEYDGTARDLLTRFEANFESFAGDVADHVKAAAVRAAA